MTRPAVVHSDNLRRSKAEPNNANPKTPKKDGAGRGNWGVPGAEVDDYKYTFTNARRRSNSSSQGLADFKTKFEAVEPDPVFEEELQGPDANWGVSVHVVSPTDSAEDSASNGSDISDEKK
jgi:hypothetical protein